MSAKSAPQLVLVHYARNAAVHLRAALISLALTLLVGGAAWLIDRSENPALEALAAAPMEVSVAPAAEFTAEPEPLAASSAPAAEPKAAPENKRHRTLSEFLAKRYKVSHAVTLDLVALAHTAGQQIGLDPLLIIAVMAVESRFNPIAESVMGAKGLMQVIPKYHTDKFREFGGVKTVFDPETNILVGSQILKEYVKRTGSLDTALRLYGGASNPDDDVYSGKVMTEKQRLQQVLRKSSVSKDVEVSIAGERIALAPVR